MNVTIVSKGFQYTKDAMQWMTERYAEYPDGSIVSSFMTKDEGWNACYIVIDKAKLKPIKKKLIKIT